MVLKPEAAIWSSIWFQLRVHRPCGAKVPVSRPNQFTPVSTTSLPCASTIFPPAACSGVRTRLSVRAESWIPSRWPDPKEVNAIAVAMMAATPAHTAE